MGEKLLENAKKHIGTEYKWDGRLTKKNPGLDCMGLVFLAYAKTTGNPWYNLSVKPSELVKNGKLGKSVEGLDGVLRDNINYELFKKGDIVYLLIKDFPIKDEPLKIINNQKYRPWHMGLYEGEKERLFLNANPMSGCVQSDPIEDLPFDAVYATRLE